MEKKPQSLASMMLVYGLCAALLVMVWILPIANSEGQKSIFRVFGSVGSIAGPVGILFLVRWINRRQDSRRARRPPDAP
jgi:Na+/melibiose symporter-like transporter